MQKYNNSVIGNTFKTGKIHDDSATSFTIARHNTDSSWLLPENTNHFSIAEEVIVESFDYKLKHGNKNLNDIEFNVLSDAISKSVKFSKISFCSEKVTPKEFTDKTFRKILKLSSDFYDYIWILGPKSSWCSTTITKHSSNMCKVEMIEALGNQKFKGLDVIASPYELTTINDDYIVGIPKNKFKIYHTHNLHDDYFKYCVASTIEDEVVYFPIDF